MVATTKNSSINLVEDEGVIHDTLVTNFIEQEKYDLVEENPYSLKKRKKTLKIWNNFIEFTLPNGFKKVKCVHCKHKLKFS